MALATWKALVIDAVEPAVLARFWGPALHKEVEEAPSGAKLVGSDPAQTVWVDTVPEPKTVKHRVHFDVHAHGPEDFPDARPLSAEGEFRWRVMADPEGGEFCVFSRETVPSYRLYEVGVDAADAEAQAVWWQSVLGGSDKHSAEGWSWVEEVPGMPFECLVFSPVLEPKTVKNRIHWDVTVPDAEGVAQLAAYGAKVLREPDAEISWTVMADPEGNEFCVFVA